MNPSFFFQNESKEKSNKSDNNKYDIENEEAKNSNNNEIKKENVEKNGNEKEEINTNILLFL